MKWTEPKPPTEGESYYDHIKCNTPLGELVIEWKSWKDNPSYDIMLDGTWIGCEYDLDKAKNEADIYLKTLFYKLKMYLEL